MWGKRNKPMKEGRPFNPRDNMRSIDEGHTYSLLVQWEDTHVRMMSAGATNEFTTKPNLTELR